jgi:hypothetical protein
MYQAIVCSANPRPHPNADRLQVMECFGETVIVGLEVQPGELGVYFPVDGQLSEEFARANDLIRRKDANGGNAGGMFDLNRKVRAQKLRGVISNGFWCPISYFDYLSPGKGFVAPFHEGMQFDTIEGQEICRKYTTPATQRAAGTPGSGKKSGRHQTPTFPMHDETAQLAYNVHQIPVGAPLVITSKAHGTSGRVGHVLDEVPLPRWKRIINDLMEGAFGWEPFKPTKDYVYLHGSRRVILSRFDHYGNQFHSHTFREQIAKTFDGKLRTGEIVFFEVVGYEPDGKPIMPPADTTKLADKSFTKQYGATMHWSYGCQPGEHKILIYRIAYSMPDGTVIDLPWRDVVKRAGEIGIETVVESCSPFFYYGNAEELMGLVSDLADGTDPLGSNWQEGVCVRVDGADPQIFKYKNPVFKFLESIIKDDPTVVDTEEAA